MTEQYPISGGRMVIGPDGVTERTTFHDAPQTADETKAFAKYAGLSPLEILRRLRLAEFNVDARGQERDEWKAAAQRLRGELNAAERKLAQYPPDGYAVPKTATDLLAYAEAYGWKTRVQWTEDHSDPPAPFVDVEVGHLLTAEEAEKRRGDRFHFKLTYHSRDCEPGKVKRFGTGLAQTPDEPQWRDAPAVWKIRQAIYENPAPDTVTVHKGPITKAEFNAIPNARAVRFSHDWMGLRYTEWIADMPGWGWSLVNDYGKPEHPCHVSRADSRSMAADRLTEFLKPNRAYGGDNLTVDEWEIGPCPVS